MNYSTEFKSIQHDVIPEEWQEFVSVEGPGDNSARADAEHYGRGDDYRYTSGLHRPSLSLTFRC